MNYSDVVIILNHYKNLMNRYFRNSEASSVVLKKSDTQPEDVEKPSFLSATAVALNKEVTLKTESIWQKFPEICPDAMRMLQKLS